MGPSDLAGGMSIKDKAVPSEPIHSGVSGLLGGLRWGLWADWQEARESVGHRSGEECPEQQDVCVVCSGSCGWLV